MFSRLPQMISSQQIKRPATSVWCAKFYLTWCIQKHFAATHATARKSADESFDLTMKTPTNAAAK